MADVLVEKQSGLRQNNRGINYSPSTLKSTKQTLDALLDFQKHMGKRITFNSVNMLFYRQFINYLQQNDYSTNSIGKFVRELKMCLSDAESDGINYNPKYKDKKFRVPHFDAQSIYLTRGELKRIEEVDLSKLRPCYEEARDLFLVGVWTAQRVSDYGSISRENIISADGRLAIALTQKKTKRKIIIPCSSELRTILEKYNYNLPHIWPQHMNRYIKTIGRMAGITQPVEVTRSTGGVLKQTSVPKYKLICTHTARRTGATLMYLDGMDIYDIMRITGHSSPQMLEKYIKASELEVAYKLSRKYSFFD